MKRTIILALTGICAIICGCGQQPGSNMHPQEQISFVKKQIKLGNEPYSSAYKQLIYYADSILTLKSNALEDFSVPGYYVIPEVHIANSKALFDDSFAAYTTALAYCLSGDIRYGEKSCFYLNEWGQKNKKYSDADGPLVMSYDATGLVMAAGLMRSTKLWETVDEEAFNWWLANVYRKACNEIRERKNNWADWGRFGSVLCADFLGDSEEMQKNVDLVKSDMFIKIAEDGHMPEEVRRARHGMWYTYFSLSPMTAACWVIYNNTGENLFEYEQDGKSIKLALDYALQYYNNPSAWPWNDDPYPGSHTLWPDDLYEAMYGIYKSEAYLERVEATRPHVYFEHHCVWNYATLMAPSLDGWK